ncbi:MAG: hypothetical protein FWG90_02435 [Oscillospiraceae bacterium]|nr:hypothetical protein [Oscillospiraceae bacterium]
MLTAEQFRSLKKMNASKDMEKSKKRIEEDYKAASKTQKAEIVALSGLDRTSFYKGIASLKVVLSMAQVLGVSPYYYGGVVDEKDDFSEELLSEFLNDYGQSAPARVKRQYNRKAKVDKAGKTNKKSAAKTESAGEYEVQLNETNYESAGAESTAEFSSTYESEQGDKVSKNAALKSVATDIFELDNSPKMKAMVKSLSEDSAIALLKALYIRAEVSNEAGRKLEFVKHCLLS